MEVQIREEVAAELSAEIAKIKVIGVGGGGSNMVNYLMQTDIDQRIELIVANTDAQALMKSPAPTKIQLGNNITKGLGAGMKPEVGEAAANESYEDIVSLLQGTDLVFVSAGMGGGTGTGAAPIIAKAAKAVGALTVGVVTKPFKYEGGKRAKLAESGIERLKAECDSIIVILNDKLSSMIDRSQGNKAVYRIVDSVLAGAVVGVSNIILQVGESDINVDFADMRTAMEHKGTALMGMGEANNEIGAFDAIRNAIESPLFDNLSINGARGLIAHFHIHPDYSFYEIQEAMDKVQEMLDENADVFFGTYSDPDMPKDSFEVTVVVTGLESERKFNEPQLKLPQPSAPVPAPTPKKIITQLRRVSGGDTDDLDTPSYTRMQAD
ncbi:MAG: cell division protein FtsZ [Helicobacter sp.]|nr:cell division protein FtsZ [Helicobacter sp.]MDE7254717.1 cell division protein FtsZ [Helicobacter sp.]